MLSTRRKRIHSSSENIIVLKRHKPNPNKEIAYLSPDFSKNEKNIEFSNDSSDLITAESGQKLKLEDQEEIFLEQKNLNLQEHLKELDCIFEILQPFKSIALFPGELQKKISKGMKLSKKKFYQIIHSLKTPQNHFSFLKKIEKLKLLALGQETMIKNYLKERSRNGNPIFLRDYFNLMNAKVILSQKINGIAQNFSDYDYKIENELTSQNINGINLEEEEYLNFSSEAHNDDSLNFMEISK
jgi:hypothetical protein